MPHTRVHVLNQNGTITSNHEVILRHTATSAPLFQHIATKNQWTPAVMRTINWKAHGHSLKQRIHRRVHYTKLVHDLLPVNGHVHRLDERRKQCPLCHHHIETRDHVIKCPARPRQLWRIAFLTSLDTACREHHTRPDLHRLLLHAVEGWFEQDDFFIDTSEYPRDLQRLVTQQQFWVQRNQDVHGADKASKTAAIRLDVDRTLSDLYRTKEHLDEPVRQLMRATEEEHRREPTWVTQNWIAVHGPLIRENLRVVQARAKSGMRHIRSYFAPTENH